MVPRESRRYLSKKILQSYNSLKGHISYDVYAYFQPYLYIKVMRGTHAIWNINIKRLDNAPVSVSRFCTLGSRFSDAQRDAVDSFYE